MIRSARALSTPRIESGAGSCGEGSALTTRTRILHGTRSASEASRGRYTTRTRKPTPQPAR